MTARETVRVLLDLQEETAKPITQAEFAARCGLESEAAASALSAARRGGKLGRVRIVDASGRSRLGYFVNPSGQQWLRFVEARDGLSGQDPGSRDNAAH